MKSFKNTGLLFIENNTERNIMIKGMKWIQSDKKQFFFDMMRLKKRKFNGPITNFKFFENRLKTVIKFHSEKFAGIFI